MFKRIRSFLEQKYSVLLFYILLFLGIVSIIVLISHLFIPTTILLPGHIMFKPISKIIFGDNFYMQIGRYGSLDISWIFSVIFTLITLLCVFTMKRTKIFLKISAVVYICDLAYSVYLLFEVFLTHPVYVIIILDILILLWFIFQFIIVYLHVLYIKNYNTSPVK